MMIRYLYVNPSCTHQLACPITHTVSSHSLQFVLFHDQVRHQNHYCDAIMVAMASQITSLTVVYSTVHAGADQRKGPRHWSFCGEFTGEFTAQRARNAENVSIWWRHHDSSTCACMALSWILFYWLIEQFYHVTFWHSKVKTNTFIKYHTPVYDQKHIIKRHQYNSKNNDKYHNKNQKFQS